MEARIEGGIASLPARPRQIEVRYTALSFSNPRAVRFQVKMDGLDPSWRDAGTARTAMYNDLPPGSHLFRVRAVNNDGTWSRHEASVTLLVPPLFWQTWWFRAAIAAGLVLSGGTAVGCLMHVRQRRRRVLHDRLRLAIEAATSAMVMIDEAGRIIFVNAQAERLFDYARADLLGEPIGRLLPNRLGSARPHAEDDTSAADAQNSIEAADVVGLRRDGSPRLLEIGLSSIKTDDGTPVLISMIDVSERRQADLELARQRNEIAHLSRVNMLAELSGSLAHELNQPLTAILSNAQAAQRYMDRQPVELGEVREILGDIVQQNKRAGEVIHRLRTLLKKGEIQEEYVPIDALVQDVLKLARSDLINHGVIVDAQISPAMPMVLGDAIQLQQVVLNLVMNACDATSPMPAGDRQLAVSVRQDSADQVRVSVRDSGTGIAPEHIGQLFTPFFTTKGKGMGLGLSVCRTIIRAHGGEIHGENNPDGGACFWFTLPSVSGVSR